MKTVLVSAFAIFLLIPSVVQAGPICDSLRNSLADFEKEQIKLSENIATSEGLFTKEGKEFFQTLLKQIGDFIGPNAQARRINNDLVCKSIDLHIKKHFSIIKNHLQMTPKT